MEMYIHSHQTFHVREIHASYLSRQSMKINHFLSFRKNLYFNRLVDSRLFDILQLCFRCT